MNKLPLFNAVILTDDEGVTAISFVTNPATEVQALYFNNNKPLVFADESKHMITSVVMLCETPIYRRNDSFEYFVQYERKTLEDMARKMLKDKTFNNISFEHNGEIIPDGNIELVELYLKDENKPSPFENIKNGSIIATYKVVNEKMWAMLKENPLSISLEGYFDLQEAEEKYVEKYYNNKMKIKDAFKRLLTNFTELTVGDNTWVFDGELEVGTSVVLEDGNAVEDGEYEVDGKTVVIKDGKVEAINEPETEETEEEMAEEETIIEEVEDETPAETESEDASLAADLEALKAIVDTLVTDVESIKTTLSDLVKTPVAEPAVDEYSNVVKKETGSKLKNTANILSLK